LTLIGQRLVPAHYHPSVYPFFGLPASQKECKSQIVYTQ
jgi:hypothetical protein